MGVNESTPLYALTIGQFIQLQKMSIPIPKAEKREYVFGLRGIMTLFGISHTSAQAWKNTWLAPACEQTGRNIQVDVEKARALYRERSEKEAQL